MKQKTITVILTLVAILAPLLILPNSVVENYNILKLIVLLISGLALLILLLASYKTLTIDKKDIIILIFLGLAFISTVLSNNIRNSILGAKNRYEGLLMFITYVVIYMCSKKFLKYEKTKIFLNIMFYVSIIIGVLGIVQKHVSYNTLYPLFNKGICSTFGNSNFFGSFISLSLPISCTVFIFNGNKKSFILSLIMFFNMIASGTRSAWVAFSIIGLIGLIYLIKQKNKTFFKRAIILLILFIIICIYLFGGFGFVPQTVINADINSTNDPITKLEQIKGDLTQIKADENIGTIGSGRILIWKITLNYIIKQPIYGSGPDNLFGGLIENCKEEIFDFMQKTGTKFDKAHNEYLHIAATLGIPALICYLIFIGLILFSKVKLVLNNKVYFIICLTIISYLVQAFFNISTIGVAPLFWMILGLVDNKEFVDKLSNKFI